MALFTETADRLSSSLSQRSNARARLQAQKSAALEPAPFGTFPLGAGKGRESFAHDAHGLPLSRWSTDSIESRPERPMRRAKQWLLKKVRVRLPTAFHLDAPTQVVLPKPVVPCEQTATAQHNRPYSNAHVSQTLSASSRASLGLWLGTLDWPVQRGLESLEPEDSICAESSDLSPSENFVDCNSEASSRSSQSFDLAALQRMMAHQELNTSSPSLKAERRETSIVGPSRWDARYKKRPPKAVARVEHARLAAQSVQQTIRFSEALHDASLSLDTLFELPESQPHVPSPLRRQTSFGSLRRAPSVQSIRRIVARPALLHTRSDFSTNTCMSEQRRESVGPLPRLFSSEDFVSSMATFMTPTSSPALHSDDADGFISSAALGRDDDALSQRLSIDGVLIDSDAASQSEKWALGFSSVPLTPKGVAYLQAREDQKLKRVKSLVRRHAPTPATLRQFGFFYVGIVSTPAESKAMVEVLKERGILDARRRLVLGMGRPQILEALFSSRFHTLSLTKQREVVDYLLYVDAMRSDSELGRQVTP